MHTSCLTCIRPWIGSPVPTLKKVEINCSGWVELHSGFQGKDFDVSRRVETAIYEKQEGRDPAFWMELISTRPYISIQNWSSGHTYSRLPSFPATTNIYLEEDCPKVRRELSQELSRFGERIKNLGGFGRLLLLLPSPPLKNFTHLNAWSCGGGWGVGGLG